MCAAAKLYGDQCDFNYTVQPSDTYQSMHALLNLNYLNYTEADLCCYNGNQDLAAAQTTAIPCESQLAQYDHSNCACIPAENSPPSPEAPPSSSSAGVAVAVAVAVPLVLLALAAALLTGWLWRRKQSRLRAKSMVAVPIVPIPNLVCTATLQCSGTAKCNVPA